MSTASLQVKTGYRDIWRIAWPIMISSMANTIINFTDTAFVARVGETELAASAIGGVFYFVLVMMGIAIGIGAQIMIARKAGENDTQGIGSIFDHSLVMLLSMAVFMIMVCYTVMPVFISKIINSAAVASAATVYIKARSWGLFFMMILVALRCFYTGIAQTRIIGYSTVLMMVLNFILGYAMTFGHFGFEAMGIRGVGIASACSETIAALYAIVYTFVHKCIRPFGLFRFVEMKTTLFKQMFTLSSPILLQHFISMGSWFLFFVLIEKMGQHALAISNVVRSIYMVLMTPIWGYSQASNAMVSNIIGQQKTADVLSLSGRIIKMSFITSSITILAVLVKPEWLLQLVTSDTAIINDSVYCLYIVCAATLFFSVSMILLSAVSGTGDTRAAMVIEIVNIAAYILFIVLCTEVFQTSVEVVWLSEIQYWILMGLMAYFYLRSNKWKKQIVTAETT